MENTVSDSKLGLRKYIEIVYYPTPEHEGYPWLMTMGNLPKDPNGKKYRIFVEEVEDDNTQG